ncbi:MAG: hypothetical protein ACRDEA_23645, partial [Microcystaceae cyanobacterium]
MLLVELPWQQARLLKPLHRRLVQLLLPLQDLCLHQDLVQLLLPLQDLRLHQRLAQLLLPLLNQPYRYLKKQVTLGSVV